MGDPVPPSSSAVAPPPASVIPKEQLQQYVSNPSTFIKLFDKWEFLHFAADVTSQLSRTQVRELLTNAQGMKPKFNFQLFSLLLKKEYNSSAFPGILAAFYQKSNQPITIESLTQDRQFTFDDVITFDKIIDGLRNTVGCWELLREFLLHAEVQIPITLAHNLVLEVPADNPIHPIRQHVLFIVKERVTHLLRQSPSDKSLLEIQKILDKTPPVFIASKSPAPDSKLTFPKISYDNYQFHNTKNSPTLSTAFRSLSRIDRAIIFQMLDAAARKEILKKIQTDLASPAKLFFESLFQDVFPHYSEQFIYQYQWLADLDLSADLQENTLDLNTFSKIAEREMFDALAYLLTHLSPAMAAKVIASLTPFAWASMLEFKFKSEKLLSIIHQKIMSLTEQECQALLNNTQQDFLSLINSFSNLENVAALYIKYHAQFDTHVYSARSIIDLIAEVKKQHARKFLEENSARTSYSTSYNRIYDDSVLVRRICQEFEQNPRIWINLFTYSHPINLAIFYFKKTNKQEKIAILNEIGIDQIQKYICKSCEPFHSDATTKEWLAQSYATDPKSFIRLMNEQFNLAAANFSWMTSAQHALLLQNAREQKVPLMETLIEFFALGACGARGYKVNINMIPHPVKHTRFISTTKVLENSRTYTLHEYKYLSYIIGSWKLCPPGMGGKYCWFNVNDTVVLNGLQEYISKENYLRSACEEMLTKLILIAGKVELEWKENFAFIVDICIGLSCFGKMNIKNYFLENTSKPIRDALLDWLNNPSQDVIVEAIQSLDKWLKTEEASQRLKAEPVVASAPVDEPLVPPPPVFPAVNPELPPIDEEKLALAQENTRLQEENEALQQESERYNARLREFKGKNAASSSAAPPSSSSIDVNAQLEQMQALFEQLLQRDDRVLNQAYEEIAQLKARVAKLEAQQPLASATLQPFITSPIYPAQESVVINELALEEAQELDGTSNDLQCPLW